jgi:hypothetical protein
MLASFAPPGFGKLRLLPRAYALGYILAPLRAFAYPDDGPAAPRA